MEFSFNLPRSSWNSLTDRPKNLSVYLEIFSFDRKIDDSIPLFRLTKEPFPIFYGPFFQDKLSWPEKNSLMASFTDKQLSEIDKYSRSIKWYYDSEQSLISLLNEVKEQLMNVGIPAIDFFKNYQLAEMETLNLNLAIRTKVRQLYLKQVDPSSRFPAD